MNGELVAAVRQAIKESEGAVEEALNEILTIQARAAVQAMEAYGYILPAGHEYGVMRGDVTEEVGFNTRGQAERFAAARFPDGDYIIRHRPVGVWEEIGTPGLPSGSPEPKTNPDEDM